MPKFSDSKTLGTTSGKTAPQCNYHIDRRIALHAKNKITRTPHDAAPAPGVWYSQEQFYAEDEVEGSFPSIISPSSEVASAPTLDERIESRKSGGSVNVSTGASLGFDGLYWPAKEWIPELNSPAGDV